MKISEIQVGSTYSNGKGRTRKIIDRGPQYILYPGQVCRDNLQYEIVNDGTKANRTAGDKSNITVQAFASWAKERVD